jgi:hypothetical protein
MKHTQKEIEKSRDYWTWIKVYTLGRQSTDGGVRMLCERLAANISKGVPLTGYDIQQLDRLKSKP